MSKRVDLLRLIVIGDMYGVINTCGDLLCYEGNFSAYFDECTGKNGTLEIIERKW